MTRIGFAGLGRMGKPMARNVLRAGFELTVYNRTRQCAEPLEREGAAVAETPAALGRGADVLVTMVADAGAAEAVLLGDDGALASLAPGSIIIEMSTIGPHAARLLAAAAAGKGVDLLDAPVSGSVSVAEAAQLTTIVGGQRDAFKRARPVLEAMTKAQFYLGPSGAGAAMKLALNSAVALANEAIAEALALAEGAGIPREDAYEVLRASVVASPFLEYKRAAFIEPGQTPVAFTTAQMRKDLTLALDFAEERGVRMPATRTVAEVFDIAGRAGFGEADFARVADVLRSLDDKGDAR
jgi:3-hydroxyisobutyrate dehydrogenase-like beta-hydroxyacid dehydrogenase